MHMGTFWLILLIGLIIIELMTMALTTVWFAGGALAAAIVAGIGGPVWLQVVVFLLISLMLLLFTRPIAVKYFNKDREKTNVESMIGKQAIVISEIDNIEGIGQVTVGGQEWSARSLDDMVKLPIGAVVYIRAVSGVKLIVEEKEL